MKNTVDYKAIGRRIRIARKNRNLTQEKLLESVNMSSSHISNIETGATKVSLPTLINIVNALGVTLDTVCCDNLTNARKEITGQIVALFDDLSDVEIRLLLDIMLVVTEILRKEEGEK